MCAWFKKFADRSIGKNEERSETIERSAVVTRVTEPKAPRRRVTIGLDFGTSSSKCCYLEEGPGKRFTAVVFKGADHPCLLYRTIARHTGGVLQFGPDLDAGDGGEVVRSFKMCLLCQARNEEGGESLECSRCSSKRPGHFHFGELWMSAEDLSTLYLSVILSEVLASLHIFLGTEPGSVRVQVNAAAPLDQLKEFGSVEEYFKRSFFYALRLAESRAPRREWAVQDAMDSLKRVREEPVPEDSMSPSRVFPETHAAITAYALLPQSEKGLYAIVDIGAGTTDVSFFWLQKDEATTAAWYYAAGTESVGMDDVDRALVGVLSKTADLRTAREALSNKQLSKHSDLIKPVERRVYKHYARVHKAATVVDQRDRAWCKMGVCQFKLFLVGGGSRCRPLVQRLRKEPLLSISWASRPEELSVPEKMAALLPAGRVSTIRDLKLSSDAPLMLLALGLSHRRVDIPKYARDETGVPKKVQGVKEGWTVEEMYGYF